MQMLNEQAETACFDVDGVRYRYLYMKEEDPTRGRRRSPVLFVHGFAQNALSWFPASRTIFLERDVYGIDLVGHGGSAVPFQPAPYSLTAMGEALLALIKLIPGKPLVVGYSMGGRVALSALLEAGPAAFAKQTSGLLLESVGMGPKTQAERDEAIERDSDTARRLREMPLKDFMTYWENLPLFASQKALPKKVRAAVRANRLANDSEALAKCVECAGQHRMPSYRETTAALRDLGLRGYPALYLAGEKDAKYSKLAMSLHEDGIVRTRIAPKVGHNVHLEAPEVFSACVHSVAAR